MIEIKEYPQLCNFHAKQYIKLLLSDKVFTYRLLNTSENWDVCKIVEPPMCDMCNKS